MQTLNLLIKPASSGCNMRCGYCFYVDIASVRAIENHGIMSDELLETIVRKALSEANGYCTFGFQGGEPTLAGLEFFQKLIIFEKKYNINNVKIVHALQTNGLLIDASWAGFLKENNFLVGLSIDALKYVHDVFRVDVSGNSTYDRCMSAARILANHHVNFNILSVVTRQLAAHPDKVYRFYKKNGFRYLQFIPCLDNLKDGHGSNIYSLDAKTYGNFLCRIFDLWYNDFTKNEYISIRDFDNYIHMLAGRQPENCAMNGMCSANALIEADGSVYPCDFYAVDDHLLGNILTHSFNEMLCGEKAISFIMPSRNVDTTCLDCEFGYICRGGCRRHRELEIDGTLQLNFYCTAYKQFFAHSLPRMKMIAQYIG